MKNQTDLEKNISEKQEEIEDSKEGLKAMMWSYKDSALTLMERKEESQEV